jgi:hypothetical protein
MNKGLGHELLQRVKNLPFIDIAAGIVSTQIETNYLEDATGQARTVVNKYPVTSDVARSVPCDDLVVMIPDSSLCGMLYMEDLSCEYTGSHGNLLNFNSRIRIVIWVNTKKLSSNNPAIAAAMLSKLITQLTGNPFNSGWYQKISIKPATVSKSGPELFSQYNYKEETMQYLMPPFDSIGMDLLISFGIRDNCITEVTKTVEVC